MKGQHAAEPHLGILRPHYDAKGEEEARERLVALIARIFGTGTTRNKRLTITSLVAAVVILLALSIVYGTAPSPQFAIGTIATAAAGCATLVSSEKSLPLVLSSLTLQALT